MDQAPASPLARALGRVPTGLYIVSTPPVEPGGPPVGFVGSFVMQVGLEPPVLCVAVGKARGPLTAIRTAGRFGLSILDGASQAVMSRFFKRYDPGSSPFDGLELDQAAGGTPVLATSLAWLECEVQGEHETGDHVVVFGEVTDGRLVREGDPSVHLRKNGLGY
jgi:flavin reductase (DIM6/NTAB) family NADH-FMN oxidoreductase RutF